MLAGEVDAEEQHDVVLPFLRSHNLFKPLPSTASSLLSTFKNATSNPFKTLSDPIDSLIGPELRPGYALQISSPPGLYVEQLLIGFIKNVTHVGKEVMVIGG